MPFASPSLWNGAAEKLITHVWHPLPDLMTGLFLSTQQNTDHLCTQPFHTKLMLLIRDKLTSFPQSKTTAMLDSKRRTSHQLKQCSLDPAAWWQQKNSWSVRPLRWICCALQTLTVLSWKESCSSSGVVHLGNKWKNHALFVKNHVLFQTVLLFVFWCFS